MDTFPKVMQIAFPGVTYNLSKSQIWFGGLDDKERTEKILGQEHATIYLNECSQIPQASRDMAATRLAQLVQTTWRTAHRGCSSHACTTTATRPQGALVVSHVRAEDRSGEQAAPDEAG
jgi:hypothetical protein